MTVAGDVKQMLGSSDPGDSAASIRSWVARAQPSPAALRAGPPEHRCDGSGGSGRLQRLTTRGRCRRCPGLQTQVRRDLLDQPYGHLPGLRARRRCGGQHDVPLRPPRQSRAYPRHV